MAEVFEAPIMKDLRLNEVTTTNAVLPLILNFRFVGFMSFEAPIMKDLRLNEVTTRNAMIHPCHLVGNEDLAQH